MQKVIEDECNAFVQLLKSQVRGKQGQMFGV